MRTEKQTSRPPHKQPRRFARLPVHLLPYCFPSGGRHWLACGAGARCVGRLRCGRSLPLASGLERKAKEAKAFYSLLAIATLIGLALNFAGVDPIRALVWSAMINGVTAAPVMVFMMLRQLTRHVRSQQSSGAYLDK